MYGFESRDINTASNTEEFRDVDYVFVSKNGTELNKLSYGELAKALLEQFRFTVNGHTMSVKEFTELYGINLEITEF